MLYTTVGIYESSGYVRKSHALVDIVQIAADIYQGMDRVAI